MKLTQFTFQNPKDLTLDFAKNTIALEKRSHKLVSHNPQTLTRRFMQYETEARKTSPHVGPGTYDVQPSAKTRFAPKEKTVKSNNITYYVPQRRLSIGSVINISTNKRPRNMTRSLKIRMCKRSEFSPNFRNKKRKHTDTVCISPMEIWD